MERFELLREQLSALAHEQWIAWSQNIAETEAITPERLERWKELWKPYDFLTEAQKDQNREWPDRAILIVRKLAVLMWLTPEERESFERKGL
jgi:hypothetical protein